jgi:hypothetical protein
MKKKKEGKRGLLVVMLSRKNLSHQPRLPQL